MTDLTDVQKMNLIEALAKEEVFGQNMAELAYLKNTLSISLQGPTLYEKGVLDFLEKASLAIESSKKVTVCLKNILAGNPINDPKKGPTEENFSALKVAMKEHEDRIVEAAFLFESNKIGFMTSEDKGKERLIKLLKDQTDESGKPKPVSAWAINTVQHIPRFLLYAKEFTKDQPKNATTAALNDIYFSDASDASSRLNEKIRDNEILRLMDFLKNFSQGNGKPQEALKVLLDLSKQGKVPDLDPTVLNNVLNNLAKANVAIPNVTVLDPAKIQRGELAAKVLAGYIMAGIPIEFEMFGMKNGVEVWKGALDGEPIEINLPSTLLKNQKEVFKANETINKLKEEGFHVNSGNFALKALESVIGNRSISKGLFNKKEKSEFKKAKQSIILNVMKEINLATEDNFDNLGTSEEVTKALVYLNARTYKGKRKEGEISLLDEMAIDKGGVFTISLSPADLKNPDEVIKALDVALKLKEKGVNVQFSDSFNEALTLPKNKKFEKTINQILLDASKEGQEIENKTEAESPPRAPISNSASNPPVSEEPPLRIKLPVSEKDVKKPVASASADPGATREPAPRKPSPPPRPRLQKSGPASRDLTSNPVKEFQAKLSNLTRGNKKPNEFQDSLNAAIDAINQANSSENLPNIDFSVLAPALIILDQESQLKFIDEDLSSEKKQTIIISVPEPSNSKTVIEAFQAAIILRAKGFKIGFTDDFVQKAAMLGDIEINGLNYQKEMRQFINGFKKAKEKAVSPPLPTPASASTSTTNTVARPSAPPSTPKSAVSNKPKPPSHPAPKRPNTPTITSNVTPSVSTTAAPLVSPSSTGSKPFPPSGRPTLPTGVSPSGAQPRGMVAPPVFHIPGAHNIPSRSDGATAINVAEVNLPQKAGDVHKKGIREVAKLAGRKLTVETVGSKHHYMLAPPSGFKAESGSKEIYDKVAADTIKMIRDNKPRVLTITPHESVKSDLFMASIQAEMNKPENRDLNTTITINIGNNKTHIISAQAVPDENAKKRPGK
jgi:hypothetical protein